MARPQTRMTDEPQAQAAGPKREWGDALPAFVREISWLRWLGPLSAERLCAVPPPRSNQQ